MLLLLLFTVLSDMIDFIEILLPQFQKSGITLTDHILKKKKKTISERWRGKKAFTNQGRMITRHVTTVVVLPQFDVPRGDDRLKDLI